MQNLDVAVNAGTGHGTKHAYDKGFKGRPFPLQGGAVATFDIMFKNGYEWSCRGKIGGFFMGSGKASGGQHSSGAASMRMCWNGGGGAFAYVYVPTGTSGRQPPAIAKGNGKWGVLIWESEFRGVFTYDKWSRVRMGLTLNSPGQGNGTMFMEIDGRRASMSGITWRTGKEPVSSFVLDVFHGGPCRATKNSALSIRNLSVSGLSGGGSAHLVDGVGYPAWHEQVMTPGWGQNSDAGWAAWGGGGDLDDSDDWP